MEFACGVRGAPRGLTRGWEYKCIVRKGAQAYIYERVKGLAWVYVVTKFSLLTGQAVAAVLTYVERDCRLLG